MTTSKRIFLCGGLAIAMVLIAGCSTMKVSVANVEKMEKDRPSMAETKAIAEEGFIYGLPIVMNYAVMYEYVVNRNSGQFKAPFNQINNEARLRWRSAAGEHDRPTKRTLKQ